MHKGGHIIKLMNTQHFDRIKAEKKRKTIKIYNTCTVMYPQKLTESVIKTKQSGRSFHAFMALEKKKELLNEIVFSDMHIIPCVLFSWEEILFGWS